MISVAMALAALAVSIWHPGMRGGFGPALEGRLLDARFAVRGPVAPGDAVAIVAFDDLAVATFAAFPPSRADIAATVNAVFDAGARAVALDFLLVDPRADDVLLAAALARGASVIGVAEAPSGAPLPPLRAAEGFAVLSGLATGTPLPALAPAPGLQSHAGLGAVTVQHAADGALRRLHPALAVQTQEGVRVVPGLALVALAPSAPRPRLSVKPGGAGGSLAGPWPIVSLDLLGGLPLNFYGPEGAIPTVSAAAVGGSELANKVVFIGATATGFGDRHATAYDATLPGVEAHATLAANLLAGQVLRRDALAWAFGAGLAVVCALAGLAASAQTRPWAALAASATVAAVALGLLQWAFVAGWWLDALSVLLSLGLGLATGSALRFLDTRRRAATLARFQAPRLVEAIAAQSDLFGKRPPQPAVVLFVDVVDFTARAEALGPARTADFLRDFHSLVEAAADPLGGTIMDFVGDGVLVVFGLPDGAGDDADRAVRFLQTLFGTAGHQAIGLRAGGHAGLVQMSLLGGATHRTVSISGDVVNTASRLQEIAKVHGAAIALSDALLRQAPVARDWIAAERLTPLHDQKLRGRSALETVWVGSVPAA